MANTLFYLILVCIVISGVLSFAFMDASKRKTGGKLLGVIYIATIILMFMMKYAFTFRVIKRYW